MYQKSSLKDTFFVYLLVQHDQFRIEFDIRFYDQLFNYTIYLENAYFLDSVLTSMKDSQGRFKKDHIPWNKGNWWSYKKASKYMQGTDIKTRLEFNAKKSTLEPILKMQIPKDPPTGYPNFSEMGGWPRFLTGKIFTPLTKEEKKRNEKNFREKFFSNPENRSKKNADTAKQEREVKKLVMTGYSDSELQSIYQGIFAEIEYLELHKYKSKISTKELSKKFSILIEKRKGHELIDMNMRKDSKRFDNLIKHKNKIEKTVKICCIHCGITETDFLGIDHINGRDVVGHTKSHTGNTLYRELRDTGFPKGFQTLCGNWNQIKTKKEKEINHSMTRSAILHRAVENKNKKECLAEYSNADKPKCVCCGYDQIDGLSLDHIKNRNDPIYADEPDEHGDKIYRHLRNLGYPEGNHQTMCFNCNGAKTDFGYCPHEKMPKDLKNLENMTKEKVELRKEWGLYI